MIIGHVPSGIHLNELDLLEMHNVQELQEHPFSFPAFLWSFRDDLSLCIKDTKVYTKIMTYNLMSWLESKAVIRVRFPKTFWKLHKLE